MENRPNSAADFDQTRRELKEKYEEGKRTATEAIHDAKDEISRKSGEYADEAKSALFHQAEGTQRDISANMKAFGGALRAASEHLAGADQAAAAKFVSDAAGGLDRLSSSLKEKPFEEVLGDIRAFGKENSGALIAGSVLAGLALGRLLKSSSEPANASGDRTAGSAPAGSAQGSGSHPAEAGSRDAGSRDYGFGTSAEVGP